MQPRVVIDNEALRVTFAIGNMGGMRRNRSKQSIRHRIRSY
jgi:hypothetical protein